MLLDFVVEHRQDVVLLAHDFIVTEIQYGECLCEIMIE